MLIVFSLLGLEINVCFFVAWEFGGSAFGQVEGSGVCDLVCVLIWGLRIFQVFQGL